MKFGCKLPRFFYRQAFSFCSNKNCLLVSLPFDGGFRVGLDGDSELYVDVALAGGEVLQALRELRPRAHVQRARVRRAAVTVADLGTRSLDQTDRLAESKFDDAF